MTADEAEGGSLGLIRVKCVQALLAGLPLHSLHKLSRATGDAAHEQALTVMLPPSTLSVAMFMTMAG